MSSRPARCAGNGSRATVLRLSTIATTRIPTPSAECWTCFGISRRSGKSPCWARCSNSAAWSEPLHREVGKYAARCGVTVLVGIRGDARFLVESAISAGLSSDAAFFFEDPEQAGLHLRSIAREGDAILFKGSRGTRVEKALERFLE